MKRYKFKVYLAILVLFLSALGAEESVAVSKDRQISFVSPGIAFHPLGLSPSDHQTVLTTRDVVDQLRLLRRLGFRSLVTYGASGILGSIPELARQEGFDGTIIMGIWDPRSDEEWHNALRQTSFVNGYCIGNEGLGIRYEPDHLAVRMNTLRQLTGHPVTTSEPIDSYLKGPYRDWLISNSDWLFPLAHPFWASQVDPANAIDWITARHDYLVSTSSASVILKEAGVPTGGINHYNEESQIVFFKLLEKTGVPFFYFEAFDQPWKPATQKHHEAEAHWGIYRKDGHPKAIVGWLRSRFARQ